MLIRFTLIFTFFSVFITPNLAQSYADCETAKEICEKKTYKIASANGEGANTKEANFITCFLNGENRGRAEENSTWIKFEIAEPGKLSFTITPQVSTNDIDFVVYRLGANGTCDSKKVVRCMAAGASPDDIYGKNCLGKTGLKSGETDTSEDAGCADSLDNAWLAPLSVKKGEKYLLLVSNVTEPGPGFSISFSGTAKLPCDKKPEKKEDKKPPKKKDETSERPNDPVVKTEEPPAVIGDRKVEVSDEVKIQNRTIKLKLWDSQVEDGDIISVYLDDKKILNQIYLRLKPQEFEITIPQGRVHYLTVFADNFGKAEPNSAMISIHDGVKEQFIDLVAGRSKQESVKIIME